MSEHDHHTEHGRDTEQAFDEPFWNERYGSSPRVWSGNPNPQLVADVSGLSPGRALGVGCGEEADAIWLAQRGWEVVATEISGVALERAVQHARDTDPAASARFEWRHVDLLVSAPEQDWFDSSRRSSCSCRPGHALDCSPRWPHPYGREETLLVVAHDLLDLATGVPRPAMPDLFYSVDDIARLLDASWTAVVNKARPRSATTRDGVTATIHDAVLLATRR